MYKRYKTFNYHSKMNQNPEPIRNTKGGKGYKKRKTRRIKVKKSDVIINIDEGEGDYALVLKNLGGKHIRIKLSNGVDVTAIIPGKMKKKRGCWLKQNMIVLVETDKHGNYELVRIVRPTDKDAKAAIEKMKKIISGTSFFVFPNDSDDDGDTDSTDDSDKTDEMAIAEKKEEDNIHDQFINPNRRLKQPSISTKWTNKKEEDSSSSNSSDSTDAEIDIQNI